MSLRIGQITTATTAAPTWNESEHPRGAADNSGQFTEKELSKSEVTLGGAPEIVFTKKYDKVKEKVEAFHAELELAVAGLGDDTNWNNYLHTMSNFHFYSLYDQLLISLQRPDASRVAGFRKWQEHDRSAMKGEKGISILRPAVVKTKEKDAAGKPVIGPDGKPVSSSKVIGFSTATVFDVSQTDGKPLPEAYAELSEEPPAGFIEDLEQSIRDAGFAVSYEAIPGNGHGFTEPTGKRVVIDEKLSPAERAMTLAHERGHIELGHLERMAEYHTGHDGARGAMEVEAESFAYVVCRAQGMSTAVGGASSTYVAGWSRTDPTAVRKSAEAVAKAVKTVLGSDLFVAREAAASGSSNGEEQLAA